jgi:uncharacterized protein
VTANIEYEVPTWNQIYDMLLCMAGKIVFDGYKPDVVVGVARGGVVAARVLADLLGASVLVVVGVGFYVDVAQVGLEPVLKQPLPAFCVLGKKTLVVDDIADSGRSLKLVKAYLAAQGSLEVKTATLYAKEGSIVTPDYFEKQTSRWVVFPWDAKETLQSIIRTHKGKRSAAAEIAKLVKAGLPKQLAEKLLKDLK